MRMPYIKCYGVGSTFTEVSKQDVENIKVVLPNCELVLLFNSTDNGTFDRISILEKENHQLASLCDWLLSMLMNEQVTFKEMV